MKASNGNRFKGMAFILVGMAAALLLWVVLMNLDLDVVYISTKKAGMSYLIPILTCIPSIVAFNVWFSGRKSRGEKTQIMDNSLYTFTMALISALALDVVLGVAGMMLVGTKYMAAAGIDLLISMVFQTIASALAFVLCPPYPKK